MIRDLGSGLPAYLTARIVEPGESWWDQAAGHMRQAPVGQLHVRCEACPWWISVATPDREAAEGLRIEHLTGHHWTDLLTGRCGLNPPEAIEEAHDRIGETFDRVRATLDRARARQAEETAPTTSRSLVLGEILR